MTRRRTWPCVASLPAAAGVSADPVTVTIGPPAGELQPLLGVDIGPLPSGEPGQAELTAAYRERGGGRARGCRGGDDPGLGRAVGELGP